MAGQMEEKNKKSRMCWNDESEAALMDMWPTKLGALRGHRKNGHIYTEMAEELSRQGLSCSPRDVQVKIQNYTQRYRKEKAMMGVSGGSPSTWCHYQTVHQVIAACKGNMINELTLESIDDDSDSSLAATSSATNISAPSPGAPASAPSSLLCLFSPAPSPSTSEPARKKRKFKFRELVAENFGNISNEMENLLAKSEERENVLIELEKKR